MNYEESEYIFQIYKYIQSPSFRLKIQNYTIKIIKKSKYITKYDLF